MKCLSYIFKDVFINSNSSIKYLLSTYSVPSTVLSAGNAVLNKNRYKSYAPKAYFLVKDEWN